MKEENKVLRQKIEETGERTDRLKKETTAAVWVRFEDKSKKYFFSDNELLGDHETNAFVKRRLYQKIQI